MTEQKGCVLVLDEIGSRRWEDLEGLEFEDGRHLEMYYARGDLCIGTCTQGIGEVLCVNGLVRTTVCTILRLV